MEDHDLLIRIDERMERVEEMLDGGRETFQTHDLRIRELEQNHSKIMGIVIAVGAGVTTGIHLLIWLWDQIRWK